jgi:acetoin utilization deacetylase AcuC-like enzyme
MASVAYYSHPACAAHQTGTGHVESAARLAAVAAAMQASGVQETVTNGTIRPATPAELQRVHSQRYVEAVLALEGQHGRLDYDTVISPGSIGAALHAAGSGIVAVEEVIAGSSLAAFCCVRPPGHHAERDRGMGFCIFNNVAVAAAAALASGAIQRVLVFDPDVHHGNGTEEIFYTSAAVYYVSIHRHGVPRPGTAALPFYPGTGGAGERGAGPGAGHNLNLPLPAGAGDAEYSVAFARALEAIAAYAPQLVLVSAGFDAHELDPLGGMRVTTDGFVNMYRALFGALALAGIPAMVTLEGGYSLRALEETVPAVVAELVASVAGV